MMNLDADGQPIRYGMNPTATCGPPIEPVPREVRCKVCFHRCLDRDCHQCLQEHCEWCADTLREPVPFTEVWGI